MRIQIQTNLLEVIKMFILWNKSLFVSKRIKSRGGIYE